MKYWALQTVDYYHFTEYVLWDKNYTTGLIYIKLVNTYVPTLIFATIFQCSYKYFFLPPLCLPLHPSLPPTSLSFFFSFLCMHMNIRRQLVEVSILFPLRGSGFSNPGHQTTVAGWAMEPCSKPDFYVGAGEWNNPHNCIANTLLTELSTYIRNSFLKVIRITKY